MVHIRPVVVRALRPAAALALAAAMMAVPATAQPASPDAINAQGRSRTLPVITRNEDLLAKFGGRDGLVRIMDDFMINLLADPRTRPFFEAHAGMGVATANFYALVEALQKAMNKHDVPFAAQNRLVAALAPMHRDVITK